MDPQLTKQLNRRRLILESSLKTSIKDENKIKKIEVSSSIFVKDIKPSNNTKNNFLEKLKKFESFSDPKIKVTHQNIVNRLKNNTEIVKKSDKLNIDPVLKKSQIINKLEFERSKSVFINSKQNQGSLHEKIKQFESNNSLVLDNKTLKENTYNVHPQTSNESSKTLKTRICSKSDYNNWELDKTWTFYRDYSANSNNTNNMLESKLLRRKEKNSGGIVYNTKKIFSIN